MARFEQGLRVTRRPQSPYVCRTCPKWVKEYNVAGELALYVVASCGQERAYAYWTVGASDAANGEGEEWFAR